MTRIEKQVVINRPVEEVLRFTREWANMPQYLDYIQAVRPLGDKVAGKGARFHVDLNFLGRSMTSEWELVEDDPGKGWTFKTPLMGIDALKHWRFEPVGTSTRASFTLEYKPGPPVIGALVDALIIRRKWDQIFERGLLQLKCVVEAR